MTDRPQLFSFRRCPYAMRARMALLVSGTAFDTIEVKLSAKPPALLAASPKGTVPVLALPGGQIIDESLDIMRWALARHDPEDWLAADDPALIAVNDGAFKHHLDRAKYPQRHGENPEPHRAAALALLGTLEERLTTRANLCRDTPGFADIAIMPFVRQFAGIDPGWFAAQPVPRVQAWLARHMELPLFMAVMARV
ncbi:MAG: glutathione S-transferase [Polymorphobacter sp.]